MPTETCHPVTVSSTFPFWTFSSMQFSWSRKRFSFLLGRSRTLCSWLLDRKTSFRLHFTCPPSLALLLFAWNCFLCVWWNLVFRAKEVFKNIFFKLPCKYFPNFGAMTSSSSSACIFCWVENLICVWAERSGWAYHLPPLPNSTKVWSPDVWWSPNIRRAEKFAKSNQEKGKNSKVRFLAIDSLQKSQEIRRRWMVSSLVSFLVCMIKYHHHWA